jgi:hypothetical protein
MKAIDLALLVCAFALPQLTGAQAATDLNCTQCVESKDMANASIGSAKIKDRSVSTNDIAVGAVKSAIINDGAVTRNKLSPGVREMVEGAIASIRADFNAAQDYSVAVAPCGADNAIAVAANCNCSPDFTENNIGVLLACAVEGNVGMAACLPDAATFDPNKTEPVAHAGVTCLAATSADGTPFIPAPTGLVPFSSENDMSKDSALQIAQWRMEQQKESEAAVAKYKELIATYTSRIRK